MKFYLINKWRLQRFASIKSYELVNIGLVKDAIQVPNRYSFCICILGIELELQIGRNVR